MYSLLADDRCFLNYGPIQMTIDVEIGNRKQPPIEEQIAIDVLKEFENLLPYIDKVKSYCIFEPDNNRFPKVFNKLLIASNILKDSSYTLLAAIAGAFSEFALEKALEYGGERIIINNGGDIALKDITGRVINVGIPLSLKNQPSDFLHVSIKPEDGIEGICTSGFGGRSFTKGIASIAVALASKASFADICATCIANQTNVEDINIIRSKAEDIDSETDIKGQWVTLKVDNLDRKNKLLALLSGYSVIERLFKGTAIKGGIVAIDTDIMMLPNKLAKLKSN